MGLLVSAKDSPSVMPHVLGRGKVVVQKPLFRSGIENKFQSDVRWWAERGILRAEWVDHKGRQRYTVIRIRDAMERLRAMDDFAKRSKRSIVDRCLYGDEIVALERFIKEYAELIEIAKEQGSPFSKDGVKVAQARLPTKVSIPTQICTEEF